MELAKWINPIYAFLHWIVILVLLRPKRIIELLPIGFFAILILFIAQQTLLYFELFSYQSDLWPVYGQPFFQFPAVFAYGIILISFMKEDWVKKIPIILFFVFITEVEAYLAMKVGNFVTTDKYNLGFDALITFVSYSFGVWISEGVYKERIYNKTNT